MRTKIAAMFGVVSTAIVAMATAASATPVNPLDSVTTEANTAKDSFVSFVTGTGVPLLFALLVLGVGISLAVKYVRRGARSA